MRRMRLLWAVTALAFSSVAMAQTEIAVSPEPAPVQPRSTLIAVSPQLLGNGLAVSVEHALSPRWSWELGLFGNAVGLLSPAGFLSLGAQLRPAAHVYLWGTAPSGLWVGPQLLLGMDALRSTVLTTSSSGQGTTLDASTRQTTVGGAVLVGFNLVLPYGLTLAASAGPALAHRSVISDNSNGVVSYLGLGTSLGFPLIGPGTALSLETNFAIGYAF